MIQTVCELLDEQLPPNKYVIKLMLINKRVVGILKTTQTLMITLVRWITYTLGSNNLLRNVYFKGQCIFIWLTIVTDTYQLIATFNYIEISH